MVQGGLFGESKSFRVAHAEVTWRVPREVGGLVLRDYQRAALTALSQKLESGIRRVLIALATGTGKTVIFAPLAGWFPPHTLVLAHREELVDQAAAAVQRANPAYRVEIEQAERHASDRADVIVASVQTLAMSPARLAQVALRGVRCLVLDEAHHGTAESYLTILEFFGLVPPRADVEQDPAVRAARGAARRLAIGEHYRAWQVPANAPFFVGFTATPNRHDGQGLEWIFDEIAFRMDIVEAIEGGWLVPVRGKRIKTDSNITRVGTRAGDFKQKELSSEVNSEARNALIVQTHLRECPGSPFLAFAVDMAHGRAIQEMFGKYGVEAAVVFGDTETHLRRETIARFRSGALQGLISVGVTTEGFDVPRVAAIHMARPTKSGLLYTQILGRGTRPLPGVVDGPETPAARQEAIAASGKPDLLVLDYVDAAAAGVQSLNTIFGVPPKFELPAGMDIVSAMRAIEKLAEPGVDQERLLEATDLEDVQNLVDEFDPLRAHRASAALGATLAWVRAGTGFALSMPGDRHVGIVEDLLGAWTVRLKEPEARPRDMAQGETLQDALRMAETIIRQRFPQVAPMLERQAVWRGEPATAAQKWLATLIHAQTRPDMTKGEISAAIELRLTANPDLRQVLSEPAWKNDPRRKAMEIRRVLQREERDRAEKERPSSGF